MRIKIALFEIEAIGNLHHILSDILKTIPTDALDLFFSLFLTQCEVQIIQGALSPLSPERVDYCPQLFAIKLQGFYGETPYPRNPEFEEKVPRMDFKSFS
jgi:hypothetical protein